MQFQTEALMSYTDLMKEKDHTAFDAINRCDDRLLQAILEHQGYPQGAMRFGKTLLTQAACLGSGKAIQLLLDHGAPIDQMDRDNDWPLQVAIWSENEAATLCLLRNGAKLDLFNDAGVTCEGVAEDRFPQALAWIEAARAQREAGVLDETTRETGYLPKKPRL